MILLLPDLNVWMALSVAQHVHYAAVWSWFRAVPPEYRLIFNRYTQLGILRLLTKETVMREETLTMSQAWAVYDQWALASRQGCSSTIPA